MDSLPLREGLSMHRFYADPGRSGESCFYLTPEDARHALKVLRLRPGDHAEAVFRETRYSVVLAKDGEELVLHPKQQLPSTEPSLSVTLFQGIPKGEKMEWIVQKATELGVSCVVPVAMSRCVVRLDEKEAKKKQERWARIAREAGKQSGRCAIPEIALPVPLSALPDLFSRHEKIAVPWEECESGGPLSFVSRNPSLSSLGIVIGPEGGITPEEMEFFRSAGGEAVTLGKRILRTETAGIAALGIFLALYGEME